MVTGSSLTPDCAIWAFGVKACNDFEAGLIDRDDLRLAWNKEHGDLLTIQGEDNILYTLNEISRLYKQQKDTNATGRPCKAQTSAHNTK